MTPIQQKCKELASLLRTPKLDERALEEVAALLEQIAGAETLNIYTDNGLVKGVVLLIGKQ